MVAGQLRPVEWVLWPIVLVYDVVTRWLTAAIGGDPDIEEPVVGGQGRIVVSRS